ncbi:unnamed protein product [Auanema sp. JU1783]|nr:unnamed protein product [Auanema sp. JU1783]
MKPVVFFLSLFHLITSSFIIDCGQNQFCTQTPDSEWFTYRDSAQVLRNMTTLAQEIHVYMSNNQRNQELINARDVLCEDDTFTGFLLEVDIKNSTMACIWTGDGRKSSCSPVPSHYTKKTYNFLTKKSWKNRLVNFRRSIGCSEEDINKARNVSKS